MDIDLATHGKEVLSAYNAVLKSEKDTWALFGYDRNGCSIKVLATGESLEELCDEFHDGKIQYAFLKIIHETSNLAKLILIAWCGEGVPEIKKGFFSSHFETIKQRFKGFHVQINARSQADVTPQVIRQKLKNLYGGSTHSSSHPLKSDLTDSQKAPSRDLNQPFTQTKSSEGPLHFMTSTASSQAFKSPGTSREVSKISTQVRSPQQINQASEERKPSPIPSPTFRYKADIRSTKVTQIETISSPSKAYQADVLPSRSVSERDARMNELEQMRKISGGSSVIKAWHERSQESSKNEQLERQEKSFKYTQERSVGFREELSKKGFQSQKVEVDYRAQVSIKSQSEETFPESSIHSSSQPVYQPDEQNLHEKSPEVFRETTNIVPEELESFGEALDLKTNTVDDVEAVLVDKTEALDVTDTVESTIRPSARALFDYESVEENELSFRYGEILQDIDTSYDTWWYGRNERGDYGFFPGNFVEILDTEVSESTKTHDDSYGIVSSTYTESDVNPRDEASSNFDFEGLIGRALYDYEAADETEISFKEGDIIKGIETIDEGWWRGQDSSGTIGVFPANHIELIE